MNYKILSEEVQAIQFTGDNYADIMNFANVHVQCKPRGTPALKLKTNRGDLTVFLNDWVVKDSFKDLYICRPEKFKLYYANY